MTKSDFPSNYPLNVGQVLPAELTLEQKLDDLVDEIMKDSRSMAIKKLKRMLNERL